ncbi:MAG TPA: hypothetical protein VGG71_07695 [Chitinophagaceae bacterium]
MNKESLLKEHVDYQAIGEQISHELAAKMVKNHFDKYSDDSKSYVVGKNMIEQVLAQPGCVGIRFHDAINEFGEKTLVYFGVDCKGKSILEYSTVDQHGKIAVTEGMSVDRGQTNNSWFS